MGPGERTVVTARELAPDADLTPVAADSAEELVAAVRNAVADGLNVIVAQDRFAEADEEWDEDRWIALASVLVVEGAVAIDTIHAAVARRVLDVMTAINAADETVIGA